MTTREKAAKKTNFVSYPYIPNAVSEVKAGMLRDINATSVSDLYSDIPEDLRLQGDMNLPRPFLSECSLKRHVETILSKNKSSRDYLSFLGAGCWDHHVPSVCDEVNQRGEFLTAYAGEPYDDHGRFQALFESASMIGELLEMEVVNVPTFDGFQAAATSICMASRITGRREVLISESVSKDKLSKILDYCRLQVKTVKFDRRTGLTDLNALRAAVSSETAALYLENPSYLGMIEAHVLEISDLVHKCGAEFIVGVDPISLGLLAPPSQYGADIVCGDLQPLGMHIQFGGGHAGFIATRDEQKYVMQYPSRLFGITSTSVEGEYGFGDVAYDRTSFALREEGKEFVGTAAALWGITAGVYLALMGPQGMTEIGEHIMQKSHYAMSRISKIRGIRCPALNATHFKEFVVDFRNTGKSVAAINKALLRYGIFGGKDLTGEFSDLNNCALYCVTEVHTMEDIERLVETLSEVTK